MDSCIEFELYSVYSMLLYKLYHQKRFFIKIYHIILKISFSFVIALYKLESMLSAYHKTYIITL